VKTQAKDTGKDDGEDTSGPHTPLVDSISGNSTRHTGENTAYGPPQQPRYHPPIN